MQQPPKKRMTITVEIADKPYRTKIYPEEEELVRRAAARIKHDIKEMRKRHEATHIDYLAMAALEIAIENETNIERIKYSTERLQIQEMTREIEHILSKGQK
jgi:cell division protein ZapA (FtsZ GTPase activity inhibitor)